MEEKIIPEMVVATSVCPHPEKWSAYDDMATELEVLALLKALVVALKPLRLIETGCYHGHGTQVLAQGMVENGSGVLWTCDLGAREVELTKKRVEDCEQLGLHVFVEQCSGTDLIERIPGADFAFLDSGPDEVRTEELRALFPKLSPGAVVAIHDTGIHGFLREKYLPPLLRELDMQHIFFDTPRGLTLCRKRPEIYP